MNLRENTSSVKGRVNINLEDGRFEVHLENGDNIKASIDRDMKRWSVVIVPGDIVTVEIHESYPEKAKIVFRHLQI